MREIKFINIFKMRITVLGFLALLIFGMTLGTNPVEAQPFAYVANQTSNNVSVINTATNMVVGPPIPVGTNPRDVAITPDGTRVYVTNRGSNNVSVINTATNMVVGAPIPVGATPRDVAITPDGTRAYVTNAVSNNVSVIDTATNMVVGPPIPVGTAPFGVAITPDGTRVYVANQNSNNVSVINTATNMVVGPPIPVGTNPIAVAITPLLTQFINLSPNTATNDVLTNHLVLATIEAPEPDVLVTFEVISGPNAGLMSMPNNGECFPNDCATDGNSQVSWTYSSAIPGTDIIVALFEDMTGQVIESNLVEKIWVNIVSLFPATATNDTGTDHTVTATVEIDGIPEAGGLITFEVISGPNAGLMSIPNNGECFPNDCATDGNGQVLWTYRGGKIPGTDTIVASFFDEQFQVSIESNLVEKIWESIPIPTLSEWGLIALAGILGIVGFMVMRRRKVTA